MTAENNSLAPLEDASAGLKAKNQALLGDIRRLKDELKALRSSSIARAAELAAESPRDKFFREQAARLKNLTEGTPEYQAEVDAILAMPEAQAFHDAEVGAHREALEKRMASARAAIESATLAQAADRITERLARRDSAALLRPHIAARLRAEWRDDDCVITVLDERGEASHEDALLAEFREMRPEFAAVVEGASEADKIAHEARVAATLGTAKPGARRLTRAEFDALDPDARMAAVRSGAQVVDH